MKDKYYVLFLMFTLIYTLIYGAYAYNIAGHVGLLISINFYVLGGIIGVCIRNENENKISKTKNKNGI